MHRRTVHRWRARRTRATPARLLWVRLRAALWRVSLLQPPRPPLRLRRRPRVRRQRVTRAAASRRRRRAFSARRSNCMLLAGCCSCQSWAAAAHDEDYCTCTYSREIWSIYSRILVYLIQSGCARATSPALHSLYRFACVRRPLIRLDVHRMRPAPARWAHSLLRYLPFLFPIQFPYPIHTWHLNLLRLTVLSFLLRPLSLHNLSRF